MWQPNFKTLISFIWVPNFYWDVCWCFELHVLRLKLVIYLKFWFCIVTLDYFDFPLYWFQFISTCIIISKIIFSLFLNYLKTKLPFKYGIAKMFGTLLFKLYLYPKIPCVSWPNSTVFDILGNIIFSKN
jgi:hypothetical protein